jgi:hypothetical protein
MEFKEWLLSERTLYHGTIIDNEPSIRQIGLVGQVGDFVKSSYDDEGFEGQESEVTYATDKKDLSKAITAMVHHIGKKLNRSFHDVTDNDILGHGLLVIADSEVNDMQHKKDDRDEQHPYGVEPGDYYADHIRAHSFVKGTALLRLLKRYGAWPRNWGPNNSVRSKQWKGMLIKRAIAVHPERSKQEIISKVNGLTDLQIQDYIRRYYPT